MPKIIKDLQPRIVKTAIRVFQEEGFSAIDIRRIAKESQIAVGTLYNYFPNKKALVYEVFLTLWTESIGKLDHFIEASEPNESLFILYAAALHQEMLQKNGIGKHLLRMELMETKEEDIASKALFEDGPLKGLQRAQMEKVLIKSFSLTKEQTSIKSFEQLTNTATMLLMIGNTTDQEYVQFLRDLFGSYIRECKSHAPTNF